METVRDVRQSLQRGAYAATVDLSDAYFHVNIHKESRKFLRFIFDGIIYQFVVLPFGLTSSPRIFTRVTRLEY